MKIEKITSQHRNDFRAVLVCEHCGARQDLNSGYDDDYYHNNVIPSISCKVCGATRATSPVKVVGRIKLTDFPEDKLEGDVLLAVRYRVEKGEVTLVLNGVAQYEFRAETRDNVTNVQVIPHKLEKAA